MNLIKCLIVMPIAISSLLIAKSIVAKDNYERSDASDDTLRPIIDDVDQLDGANGSWQSDDKQETQGEDVSDIIRIEDIVEPHSEYHYAAYDRPDPFKQPNLWSDLLTGSGSRSPLLAGESIDRPAGEVTEMDADGKLIRRHLEIPIISPLQKYPIRQLEVKGIWLLVSGERRAIIMTPAKEGIIVKVGDPISNGKIVTIEEKKLLVRLYQMKMDGSREFTDIDMYLGDSPPRPNPVVRLEPGKDPIYEIELKEMNENDPPVPMMQELMEKNVRENVGVIEENQPKGEDVEIIEQKM